MNVTGPWIQAAPTRAVMAALADAGHRAWFVGGCVRNDILGVPVADIDIATDAIPTAVIAAADAADIRAIPTGIDHGTVTLVHHGVPHEVTTFRKDIETDGRRAIVAFSTDMLEDASRRDFTMNALYADRNGEITDPVGGLPDLVARRVRFIGKAADRIAEDGLRILRFFRFHAAYGDAGAGMDAEALTAIKAAVGALDKVSRERIGAEMHKLLGTADPSQSLHAMAECGVLEAILPGASVGGLPRLVAIEHKYSIAPAWRRRLVSLNADGAADALRLSRADARHLNDVALCIRNAVSTHEAAYRMGKEVALDAALTGQSVPPPDLIARVELGASARFPVNGADLVDRYPAGPHLGQALKRLEQRWIDSDFALGRAELLAIDSDPQN